MLLNVIDKKNTILNVMTDKPYALSQGYEQLIKLISTLNFKFIIMFINDHEKDQIISGK